MKRCLTVFLAALLMLALTIGAIAEEKTYDEPITFSMNVIYTDRIQEDARTQYVLDKFNVDIEFITCSASDYAEKTRLWVAGGDIPDVMWTAFGIAKPEHTQYVESGLLQPWPSLDDYPNLKANQESIGNAVNESIEMNGDRYYYFTEGGYMNTNQLRPLCLYYRTDWAKAVGLYHEDHTYTWDEVMEMAIAFGQQDPGGNGQGNTIGITSSGGQYPEMYGFFQNAMDYSSFVKVDGAYHWRAGDADVVEAVKKLKYVYDNGGLWEEQIMAGGNDGANKMAAGLAGICAGVWHTDQVTSLVLGLQETYPGVNVLDIVSPMRVINDDGSISVEVSDGYWGSLCISADMDEKALERFMEMFDWMASEEGFLLSAIGIPGVDWQYNDAGEIEILWEKDEKGSYVSPYQPNAHRFVSLPRLFEGWGLESPAANNAAKVLGNRMNDWVQEADSRKLKQTDWDLAVLTAEQAPLYKNLVLSPTVNEKIQELILSSTAETIEADYLAWVESVQGQIKPVEQELTTLLCQ